jgi:hypothetical protein
LGTWVIGTRPDRAGALFFAGVFRLIRVADFLGITKYRQSGVR